MQYAGEAGLRGPAGGKRGGARLGGRGPGADPLDEDKVSRTGESGPPPSAKPSDPRSTAALFAGGRVPPGISTGTSVPPEHPAAAHRATRRPECRHRRDLRHADGYVPTPAGDLPESIHPPAQGPGDPRALSDPLSGRRCPDRERPSLGAAGEGRGRDCGVDPERIPPPALARPSRARRGRHGACSAVGAGSAPDPPGDRAFGDALIPRSTFCPREPWRHVRESAQVVDGSCASAMTCRASRPTLLTLPSNISRPRWSSPSAFGPSEASGGRASFPPPAGASPR